jgi:hypothetical protein
LSCFGRYLADAFEPPIDMKKDVSFKIVRKVISRMKKLAQATKGKKPGVHAENPIAPKTLAESLGLWCHREGHTRCSQCCWVLGIHHGLGMQSYIRGGEGAQPSSHLWPY